MDDEAIELCKEILEQLDGLPEEADEFREGVEEKVLSCLRQAESRKLSEKQMLMLEKMKAGVERWLE